MPRIADCLAALVSGMGEGLVREVIVVDGTSSDQSAQLAADMGCKVIIVSQQARGRAKQLIAGAQAASGDWMLFLHADTILQEGWVKAVSEHIDLAPSMAAFFQLAFDQSSAGAKRVARFANLRATKLGLPYGDQGLLISRVLYDQIGGYGDMPLMEDVDIVRRLGSARLVQLCVTAQTSGAKFERGGWWRTSIRNLALVSAYHMGVKPEILARWYL